MMLQAFSSACEVSESPVNLVQVRSSGCKRFFQSSYRSSQSALSGEIYTALIYALFREKSPLVNRRKIASSSSTVLPDPVGAAMTAFEFEL